MEIKYSKEFEKKRKLINQILKNNKGVEDSILLGHIDFNTNILNAYNPTYSYDNERRLEKLKGTYLSDLTDKKLLCKFTKNEFNNMDRICVESLFQEVYNRQAKEKGCEPRYVIETRGHDNGIEGYVIHGENRLNINYATIDKYMNVKETDNKYDKNANTIGMYSLLNIIDESNQALQGENVMDFVLGNDKNNPQRRAKTAISIAKGCLDYYLRSSYREYNKNDAEMKKLYSLLVDNRENDYMECDSNIETIRFLNKQAEEGNVRNKELFKVGKERIVKDLNLGNCASKEDASKVLSEKADKMEEVVNGYYHFFNKLIRGGEIKNAVSQVLGDYLKVDENGKSQFNKDLNKDFKMCVDYVSNAENRKSKLYNTTAKNKEQGLSM